MKRSQLNKIIKEQIKQLQEQPSPITPSMPTDMLSSFVAWTQLNPGVQMNWRSTVMPNVRSWLVTQIFILTPFSSGAASQPCQFICNKICQLEGWINNFSGNPASAQLAMKTYKLQVFYAMAQWAQQTWNCNPSISQNQCGNLGQPC